MPPADTTLPPSLSQTSLLTLHPLAARAVDGRWVTLHAFPLTTGEGTVIIDEPGRPDHVSAIAAHAYGLSSRNARSRSASPAASRRP